ncbi:Tim10/DDP family zinc finger-domain-containing protein [Crassisporium funariophilum]|nr:Tim10/DDP family zinc finger-domain-containing protein [Crassisporium funariophilum]
MADKFDEASQRELTEFLERQQAQARMSSQIQNFTVSCWDKCVTGTPSTRFSRSEENCLANCVDRFLDTSLFMVKQLEEKRIQSGR